MCSPIARIPGEEAAKGVDDCHSSRSLAALIDSNAATFSLCKFSYFFDSNFHLELSFEKRFFIRDTNFFNSGSPK